MVNLCRMGLHNWKRTKKSTYADATCEKHGIQEQVATRVCRKCDKVQELDIHCLGLNPPKYVRRWFYVDNSSEFIKAKKARKLAEKNNKNFIIVMNQIRTVAKEGKVSLWLKGYRESIGGYDLDVRKLLEGLGYGLNKSDEDLVIYW